jgi:hypothetical protein
MTEEGQLYGKFPALVAWYEREANRTGVTLGEILGRAPRFYRAIMDQVAEGEAALKAGNAERVDGAMERIKKLYVRATEQCAKQAA